MKTLPALSSHNPSRPVLPSQPVPAGGGRWSGSNVRVHSTLFEIRCDQLLSGRGSLTCFGLE